MYGAKHLREFQLFGIIEITYNYSLIGDILVLRAIPLLFQIYKNRFIPYPVPLPSQCFMLLKTEDCLSNVLFATRVEPSIITLLLPARAHVRLLLSWARLIKLCRNAANWMNTPIKTN